MGKTLTLLLAIVLTITLILMPACKGEEEPEPTPAPSPAPAPAPEPSPAPAPAPSPEPTPAPAPEPSPAYTGLSGEIGGINTSNPESLPEIFGGIQKVDGAEDSGEISEEEAEKLREELKEKFSEWTRATVDGIDPSKPESLKDFFDMQAVQRSGEYDEYVDPETKEYKEEQMKEKWNEWVRNRVDEINPEEAGAIKGMFDLQVIQGTAKYDDLTTDANKKYKEDQLGEKLNEWVRNRVDEIDPTQADNIKYFFWMQNIQACEKYDKFATPETHEYKEAEMKRKFNEWVEHRVNDLDPNDPNFEEELEKLRVIQLCDKYDKYIATLMHKWKEEQLKVKMDTYVVNLINKLDPLSATFWKDLSDLLKFQLSDIYDMFCPTVTRNEKQSRLAGMVTKPMGLAPALAGTYPLYGQTNVPLDQTIMIAFDQPMDPTTLEAGIEVYPPIFYEPIIMTAERFIILLHPLWPLAENTIYTITIGPEAKSWDGKPLVETYEYIIKTEAAGPAPSVVSTTPAHGTIDNMAGQPIIIKFDRSMAPIWVEDTISVKPRFDYSIYWLDNNTTAVIQSHNPLDSNTDFTVTIDDDAVSSNGVPMANDYSFSFNTAMMNLPTVMGSMPDSGQANIPSNYPIQIVFDRSMDRGSVEGLLKTSPSFSYDTKWFEANMVLEIVPTEPMVANTTYIISIDAGALSSFDLPMTSDFEFHFTTRR